LNEVDKASDAKQQNCYDNKQSAAAIIANLLYEGISKPDEEQYNRNNID
jgi:hypothetical protein